MPLTHLLTHDPTLNPTPGQQTFTLPHSPATTQLSFTALSKRPETSSLPHATKLFLQSQLAQLADSLLAIETKRTPVAMGRGLENPEFIRLVRMKLNQLLEYYLELHEGRMEKGEVAARRGDPTMVTPMFGGFNDKPICANPGSGDLTLWGRNRGGRGNRDPWEKKFKPAAGHGGASNMWDNGEMMDHLERRAREAKALYEEKLRGACWDVAMARSEAEEAKRALKYWGGFEVAVGKFDKMDPWSL